MRSTTPRNLSSAPIGIWMATALPCSFDPICSRQRLEVGADAVHLVHEADARHAVLVRLAPHRLRLGLDARHRIEHRDRAIEHAQRPLDFDGEVDVARGVDDVDAVVAQKQVVAADVIVMPRSCSCSIQSITAVPSCTSPIL